MPNIVISQKPMLTEIDDLPMSVLLVKKTLRKLMANVTDLKTLLLPGSIRIHNFAISVALMTTSLKAVVNTERNQANHVIHLVNFMKSSNRLSIAINLNLLGTLFQTAITGLHMVHAKIRIAPPIIILMTR